MNEEGREEEEEMIQGRFSIGEGGGFQKPMKLVVVGYALTSKKTKSFLQPKLERLARYRFFFFIIYRISLLFCLQNDLQNLPVLLFNNRFGCAENLRNDRVLCFDENLLSFLMNLIALPC